jgi:hypothetical protein
MMDYQQDLGVANPVAPLPDDMKVLTHEDVYKLVAGFLNSHISSE